MDRLWTPWRYSYIIGAGGDGRKGVPPALSGWPGDKKCVFCNMLAAADYAIQNDKMDREAAEQAIYLLARGKYCYVCLNAFPYSTGHVLIVPYQHVAGLAELAVEAATEMMLQARAMENVLRGIYRPDGLNLGLNLGEAAGAGVASHVHMHALPRWNGDANFMSVIGETRVLPESLETTWAKLREALPARLDE